MKKAALLISLSVFLLIPIYCQDYGNSGEAIPSALIYVGLWILLSLIVGAFGSGRKIGFGETFGISLLLSPLIGSICMATSKRNDEWQLQLSMHDMLKQIQTTVAPKPEVKGEEVHPDGNVDYREMSIAKREELMEKYGITFSRWNERYRYKEVQYSNFNDAIKDAMKMEG